MARVSPPMCSPSVSQQQGLPTPSPFTYSIASSGGWRSSQPTSHLPNILRRSFALLFSIVSSLSLLAAVSHNHNQGPSHSILHYHEFWYCLSISFFASIYSALQLLKGVHDIAFRGRHISDNKCDYITFFMDQLMAYLLISSSSALAPSIRQIERNQLKKVAITSVSMTVATFLVIAVCALESGHRLCKRIIW